ncbi:hypothetical protein PBCV1_a355L [Paramecium bursaria Chlorella virus 1]|uniref:Uncharacterized protein n=1 Tax=Paramecium bursaria Chlorella virus 1 TaxID=10506 RepID=Q84669_PBCV1|nr:hypothetical protein PBCV1_a355L [Paramecium bursaria Chlorella virus 1]AAC96723.1 hypothetical protein [Paramecium bursaria Chlorella virus 1]
MACTLCCFPFTYNIGYPFEVCICDTSITFVAYFEYRFTRNLFEISIFAPGTTFHISPGRSSKTLYENPCCFR